MPLLVTGEAYEFSAAGGTVINSTLYNNTAGFAGQGGIRAAFVTRTILSRFAEQHPR